MPTADLIFSSCSSGYIYKAKKKNKKNKKKKEKDSVATTVVPPPHERAASRGYRVPWDGLLTSKWLNGLIVILLLLNIVLTVACLSRQTTRYRYQGYSMPGDATRYYAAPPHHYGGY